MWWYFADKNAKDVMKKQNHITSSAHHAGITSFVFFTTVNNATGFLLRQNTHTLSNHSKY